MKIFATNRDIGGTNAMAPALKRLAERGHEIIALAVKSEPAFLGFSAYLPVRMPEYYGFSVLDREAMLMVLDRERLDLLLAGISTFPDASGRYALEAAGDSIPTVVIVEAWPHLWLANYGERDLPLYREATRVLAFDELSKEKFVEVGFRPEQVVVTGNPENDVLAEMRRQRVEIGSEFRRQFEIPNNSLLFTYCVTNNLEKGTIDIFPGDPKWCGFYETDTLSEFLRSVEKVSCFTSVSAVVRVKPGRERGPIEALARCHCRTVKVIGEEMRDGRPILCASDLVVGTTTIMLQTASFLGVPAVSYMPNLCREDPVVANILGAVQALYLDRDLGRLIWGFAENKFVRANLRRRFEGRNLPTDATERVVAVIEALAK